MIVPLSAILRVFRVLPRTLPVVETFYSLDFIHRPYFVLYCGRVPAANAPPDALQPKAYCTNPGR